MTAFLVLEVRVAGCSTYEAYLQAVKPVLAAHGGRYIVQSREVAALTGSFEADAFNVMAFDSADQLRACFRSDAYLGLAPLRAGLQTVRTLLVEGSVKP
jgi:uncharacterized protein (DUF1330 family)